MSLMFLNRHAPLTSINQSSAFLPHSFGLFSVTSEETLTITTQYHIKFVVRHCQYNGCTFLSSGNLIRFQLVESFQFHLNKKHGAFSKKVEPDSFEVPATFLQFKTFLYSVGSAFISGGVRRFGDDVM